MLKKKIRRLYQEKREQLGDLDLEDYNQKISEHFFNWLPDSAFTIHIYLPILQKKEINTWPIINELWNRNMNVVVPIMNMSDGSLSSWLLTPETKIQENIWGVPEPVSADFVDSEAIDLVVVPLLAYDQRGYRVGYGKGFYDSFLRTFHHQAEEYDDGTSKQAGD